MAFIDAHRKELGIEPICRELAIAPSSYHEHAARLADPGKRSVRARRDDEIKEQIKRVHQDSFGLYGTRKVWHQMRREGVKVAKCTVERLMQAMGLVGVRRGKKTITTVSNPKAPCPLDKGQPGVSGQPTQRSVGGRLYLRSYLDRVRLRRLRDRCLSHGGSWGGRSAPAPTAGFVLDALEQAIHARRPSADDGLIHHSDRGVQYLAMSYTQRLAEAEAGAVGRQRRRQRTTTPWPRPSMASTRPRSSGGNDHGQTLRRWKWQPCAG